LSSFISKDNKEIFADMQKYRPSRLITVPGFCNIIIQMLSLGMSNITGGNLDYVVTGGATLSQPVIDAFMKLNIPLYNGYGMTETANLFTGNPYSWDY
jgi:long-subunit acyl-CoA synthetase (AMP-forming)